jgi:beta-lactamase class C
MLFSIPRWVLIFGTLLFCCCSDTPPIPAPAVPIETTPPTTIAPAMRAFADQYSQYIAETVRQYGSIGAAVAIVKDSQIILVRGYGTRSPYSRQPVDANTVFRIASLSKGFAGILAGKSAAEGHFKWNDPVQQYVPDFNLRDRKQSKRIQIHHLLEHTTGLPYHAFTNLVEANYSLERITREFFPQTKLGGREGRYFAYQNAAFSLIEPVLERVEGLPYARLLQERIFKPLQMSHASCDFEAMQHTENKALPAEPLSTAYYNTIAAGGVNASADDMAHWLVALLGHRQDVIPSAVLDTVFTPRVKTGNERRILPGWIDRDDAAYGFGWRILQRGPRSYVYHGGYVNGYRCEIAFSRTEKIGVCILANAATELSGHSIQHFFELWEREGEE